ncbi:MAG: recombinase RecT [Alphaproteobacteria bacterium]|nr:recombinase RecT [Alphaproteobacteria bacterium]
MGNSLVQNQKKTFSTYMTAPNIKARINEVVGRNAQSFMTSIVSAVSANPALQECEPATILSAAFLGEGLKLSPSPQLGQYYMVPYERKVGDIKVKQAQFQLGYKGYIQLAIRSGYYRKINVIAIKDGELVRFDPLNEDIEVNLIDDFEEREAKETIGYYAMFEYTSGFRKAIYWPKSKMLCHADRFSKAFSKEKYKELLAGRIPEKDMWKYSSFWYKDFDAMAYKTMLRQLISKWGVMSVDLQKAYEADEALIKEDGTAEYIDVEEAPATVPAPEKSQIKEPEQTPANDADDDDPFDAAVA